MKIEFHADALKELEQAAAYYEFRVPGLGFDLSEEIDVALDRIGTDPEIGSVFEQPYRRVALNRFPFSIVYRIAGDTIRIVAIAHQRRLPGYWKHRK